MDKDIAGKKLLVLGGITHFIDLVKKAQEMGAVVCVADYLDDSPAKKYADKAFHVNIKDADAVEQICLQEHIDGITTGFIDFALPVAAKVCKKLNMPFWGTEEMIDICINKDKFKSACKDAGIPIAKEYPNICDPSGLTEDYIRQLEFPVIIKPIDNGGSKGVFVCHGKEELIKRYKEALEYSSKKVILVEEYLTGQHVNIYYTLSEGKAYLSGMADRYVEYPISGKAPIPIFLLHPSQYIDDFRENVDPKIRGMFGMLGMKDGAVFIQGFRGKNGGFKIYEMGYRLNGGATYSLIEACSNYNQLEMMVRFAFTGKMGSKEQLEKADAKFKGKAVNCIITISDGDVIGKIEGIEEVSQQEEVVHIVQFADKGSNIKERPFNSDRFCIAWILFVAKDFAGLEKVMDYIYKTVKVYDISGRLLPFYKIGYSEIMKNYGLPGR